MARKATGNECEDIQRDHVAEEAFDEDMKNEEFLIKTLKCSNAEMRKINYTEN